MTRLDPLLVGTLTLAGCLSVSRAQCAPVVAPGAGIPGTDGRVEASVEWDPDGSGPLGVHVVVGGSFTKLVDGRARGLGAYDPVAGSWRELGAVAGTVTTLAVRANGNLLVAGTFPSIDGVVCNSVAEFDGTTWSALGSGLAVQGPFAAMANAIVELPNGDVAVAGSIHNIQGLMIGGLARFDGANWHAFGTFAFGPGGLAPPHALCVLQNGDLVATGYFDRVDGTIAHGIARWNGAAWSPMGTGLEATGSVRSGWVLTREANGDLIVAGNFDTVDGVPAENIARWNGASWSALGGGVVGGPMCVRALPGGRLVVGGNLTPAPGVVAPALLWNGTGWQMLGIGSPRFIATLALLPGGELLAGGDFEDVASQYGRGLARWNGASWHPVAPGTVGSVRCVLNLRDGGTFVGGELQRIGGIATTGAARHDGSGWHPMPAIAVHAAAELDDGTLFAVVQTNPISPSSVDLCRWDGLAWDALPGTDSVLTLLAEPGGNLVIGGTFGTVGGSPIRGIARYAGGSWSAVVPGFTGSVSALVRLHDGRLVLAGTLAVAGVPLGRLGIWDGVALQPFAGITHTPQRLAVGPNDELFAAGWFGFPGVAAGPRVARWDGAAWTDLGAGWSVIAELPRALAALPNGDVLVGGTFATAGGVAVQNLARWDGTSWHPYGAGTDGAVLALHAAPDGRVAIGGDFVRVAGVTSAAVARLAPTCAGTLAAYGTGCSQAGAPLALTADPAWLGGAVTSRATGLPAAALALAVYGLGPVQLSLAVILPIGGAGCSLHVLPELLTAAVPTAGVSSHRIPVPSHPALLGAMVFHQVLSLELGAGGAPIGLGSTGGIAVSLGAMW